MKTKRRGISLIILIVTIIVIIILAAAVILTLSKNNPIERAREAKFKEDIRSFQDELALTIAKEYTNAGGQRDKKINASTYNEIKNYIPSFTKEYDSKFVIESDELKYFKVTTGEKGWCKTLHIESYDVPYVELEYIESTGEQYIDTKFAPTNFDTLKINYTSEIPLNGKYIIALLSNGFYYGLRRGGEDGGKYRLTMHTHTGIYSIDNTPEYNTFYEVLQDSDNVYINGMKLTKTCYAASKPSNYVGHEIPLYIFARNDDGSAGAFGAFKLKSLSIEHEGVLVRDYIPVLDKNNKPALYDKVEGEFYYNEANGEDFNYKLKE